MADERPEPPGDASGDPRPDDRQGPDAPEEPAGEDPPRSGGDEAPPAGPVRDPVQAGLPHEDLYDVATWEERTALDRLSVHLHRVLQHERDAILITLAALLLVAQLALTGYALLRRPTLGVLTLLSVVPAFALAGWVWHVDPTRREPLDSLAITFLLGVLFASFAAVLNTFLSFPFELVPVVGTALFFFLVVGPVEETVKWLAVRVHAYDRPEFGAVVDGAVYGAFAGLGFATIENAIYITRGVLQAGAQSGIDPLAAGLVTATLRSFVGPGHVVYSAFAGYYLGLAKFNPESRGPIMVKGVVIATLLHATYNTSVTYLPVQVGGVLGEIALIGFILLFDGVLLVLLVRKLSRYIDRYREVSGNRPAPEG